jgi:hypothetical protein
MSGIMTDALEQTRRTTLGEASIDLGGVEEGAATNPVLAGLPEKVAFPGETSCANVLGDPTTGKSSREFSFGMDCCPVCPSSCLVAC